MFTYKQSKFWIGEIMKNKHDRMKLLTVGVVGASALLSIFSSSASADDTKDFYFQQAQDRYYQYPTTARILGMGGSSNFTSTDSSAVVGNPAGLGFMKKGEFSGTYGHSTTSGDEFPTGREGLESTTNSGTGLMAIPLGEYPDQTPEFGNLGLGWSSNYSGYDGDSFDTSARQTKVFGAYSMNVDDSLSLGYSLGWNKDKLQSNDLYNYPMANGFRHTLGAMYKYDSDFTIGATLIAGHGRHHALFGPGFEGVSKTNQFGAGIGAQYQMGSTLVAANIDYTYLDTNGDVESSIPQNIIGGDEQGNVFNVRLGVEQAVAEGFLVRGGYRFAGLADYSYGRTELEPLDGSAYYHAVTLGAGVYFDTDWAYVPRVNLDYGVEYRAVGNDDWQHGVTLSLPFDVCPPV